MPQYIITFPDKKAKEIIAYLKKHKIKYAVMYPEVGEKNVSMVTEKELKGWGKSIEVINNLSDSSVKSKAKKKISTPVKRKKSNDDDYVLTPAIKRLLDERLKDAKENPGAEKPWSEVRKSLLKKLKAKK